MAPYLFISGLVFMIVSLRHVVDAVECAGSILLVVADVIVVG
jgi:hypothetical protein